MAFIPCIAVTDTATSKAFYEKLGFTVDSHMATGTDDIHMLLYRGELCAMLYRRAQLGTWLPNLADQPTGFSGMFYLSVEDYDDTYRDFAANAPLVRDSATDHTGTREFYITDPDGYVIGINDAASRRNSDLVGRY
jgi:lactoylglutathione lyase